MSSDPFRCPTITQKQIIKSRQFDREQAILRCLSEDRFTEKFQVKLYRLEDKLWHAQCQAHSFLTQGFEKKETARLMAELHVRYFHTIR